MKGHYERIRDIDIYDEYGEKQKKEPPESEYCKFFGCGKKLTPQEKLFGSRCEAHQKKESVLNLVDKFISQ